MFPSNVIPNKHTEKVKSNEQREQRPMKKNSDLLYVIPLSIK